MARKKDVHYKIDEGLVKEFNQIIDLKKKKGKENTITYSGVIEEMIKQYVIQNGQLVVDDLYAPRIKIAVKQAVKEEMKQIKGLIRRSEIDSTAALYSTPIMYSQIIKGMEEVMESFINTQLLNPARTRVSDKVAQTSNRKQTVQSLRRIAINDHAEQMKEKSDEEKARLNV